MSDSSFLKNDKNEPETSRDFQHGYENGWLNLDKAHYENYVSSQILYDQTIEKTEKRTAELRTLEDKLQQTQKEASQWIEHVQTYLYRITHKEQKADQLRQKARQAAQERTDLRELRTHTRNENPFLIGLFYVLAGVLFIVGDLVISKDIVAYAFGFKGFEAWSFAGGLAALSLLLKPAYERLVENYYHQGNQRRYVYFKLALVFIALTTLMVLGLYRYDAYRVDKMKSFLNTEATYLQSGTSSTNPGLIAKLDQLRRQRIELNEELLNDPWGAWSFVLTGILFALSGAVALGVGIPIVQVYWKRWVQIPIRIRKMNRTEKKALRQVDELETELAAERAQKAIGDSQLNRLYPITELQREIHSLRAELRELADQQSEYNAQRRISQYNDGYVRGKVEPEAQASAVSTTINGTKNGYQSH